MTIHAECWPGKGPVRSISVYTVEGEVGCRVRELRADRVVSYRSTASIHEFIAQRVHPGPWDIASSKGNANGNPNGKGGSSPEAEANIYGKRLLSGRGAYRNRLQETAQGADHDQAGP